jgi:myo-inositol-1-phosphate synthase
MEHKGAFTAGRKSKEGLVPQEPKQKIKEEEKEMMKIALTNLGKYNEGELVFKWLSLPYTEDELEEALEEIGIDNEEYEEYFISDVEITSPYDVLDLEVGEYENLETLNELAERLDILSIDEILKLAAMIEWGTHMELIDALDDIDSYCLDGSIDTTSDYAERWMKESSYCDLPSVITTNIDYSEMGEELMAGSDEYISSYGLIRRC